MPAEVIGQCATAILPMIKGIEASIKVAHEEANVFSPAPPVPLALKKAVSAEIEELVSKGVLATGRRIELLTCGVGKEEERTTLNVPRLQSAC